MGRSADYFVQANWELIRINFPSRRPGALVPPASECRCLRAARALVAHAPQRLVWGSDWPHVNMNDRLMPNDGDLVDLISEWIPDAATCRRILVDNACELYGFPKPG